MVVWRGLGILAVIIPFALVLAVDQIFGDNPSYPGIAFIFGGVIVGVIGKQLNTGADKIIIDKQTGEKLILRIEHSLFWIKMEYWSPIFILIGISGLLSGITNGLSTDIIYTIIPICLSVYLINKLYFKKKSKKPNLVSNSIKNNTTPTPKAFSSKSSKEGKNTDNDYRIKKEGLLTEHEIKKKELFEEMRKNRGKENDFETSDHNKYMPKSTTQENLD